jgi:FKBP-type peptidyl-prolyl cis-trans isomerase SlyD
MAIEKGSKVSLEYTLTVDEQVVDTNKGSDPLIFTQGNEEIIPGLDKQLLGLESGDEKAVTLAPEDGYGPLNEEACVEVPIEQVPEEARQIGAQLMTQGPGGHPVPLAVKDIKEEIIVLDLNHPLAGKTLNFDVKVIEVE